MLIGQEEIQKGITSESVPGTNYMDIIKKNLIKILTKNMRK